MNQWKAKFEGELKEVKRMATAAPPRQSTESAPRMQAKSTWTPRIFQVLGWSPYGSAATTKIGKLGAKDLITNEGDRFGGAT